MKVAAVRTQDNKTRLVIETRSEPVAGPGELLVRVHASSLNFHDLAVVTGTLKTDDGRIPMSDGAGEVIALGEGVKAFKIGDRVVSSFFPNWASGEPSLPRLMGVPGDHVDGFAAEYVAMPEHAFSPIPKGLSYQQAATLPCAALTAWRGLMIERRIKAGDWVLTLGTGGVSVFALQFAKMAGAQVISTSSSDEKLEKMRALGADALINYKTTPEWSAEVLKLTGGAGVDKVLEVGGPKTMPESIIACRIGGHIVLIGVLTGQGGYVPTAQLFTKNITLTGVTVASLADQKSMLAAIEANGIEPALDKDFALNEIAAAFAHQASQKHFGKITLSI